MPDEGPTTRVTPEAISKTIAFVLWEVGQRMNELILKLYSQS